VRGQNCVTRSCATCRVFRRPSGRYAFDQQFQRPRSNGSWSSTECSVRTIWRLRDGNRLAQQCFGGRASANRFAEAERLPDLSQGNNLLGRKKLASTRPSSRMTCCCRGANLDGGCVCFLLERHRRTITLEALEDRVDGLTSSARPQAFDRLSLVIDGRSSRARARQAPSTTLVFTCSRGVTRERRLGQRLRAQKSDAPSVIELTRITDDD